MRSEELFEELIKKVNFLSWCKNDIKMAESVNIFFFSVIAKLYILVSISSRA